MSKEKTTSESTYTGPSDATIKKWKEKHGENIWVLEAIHPKTKNVHIAYMHSPSIVDSQRAMASEKAKAGTYNQSIFENCVLECDPEIKNDDALLRGVLGQISEITVVAEVSIKKL